MKNKLTKKGLLKKGVLIIILIIWYGTVFSFSNQNGEQSGSLSRKVALTLVEGFDFVAGIERTEAEIEKIVENMQWGIRKVAHFTEYFLLGILWFLLIYPKNNWMSWMSLMLFIVVSAAADEFHQTFIPGRCGTPKDVLIDTMGGIAACYICTKIRLHYQKSKSRTC